MIRLCLIAMHESAQKILLVSAYVVTLSWMMTGAAAEDTSVNETLKHLREGWEKPARTYKPHTRWWWPGNALTNADITWQLEQMAAQGLGGVEIMSAWKMYEKGNVEFLSPEYLALVKHAVAEGHRLDIEVAITFSPGWSFGGSWVPHEDQSKVLSMSEMDLEGDQLFRGKLPIPKYAALRHAAQRPEGPGTLVAAVATKVIGKNKVDGNASVVITSFVSSENMELSWNVPPGKWRIMAFWLQFTGQECQAQSAKPPAMVIDHLNQGAVQRYCDHLGNTLQSALGDEFGTTIDSFFCDSFEIQTFKNSLLWSTDTLAGFEKICGYDVTPHLPALWNDVGPMTPRIRYDLGNYLHQLGLKTVFTTFGDWCAKHHVQARIQPHYRFTEEIVQGAGATARPETEVTTARFEPVADPRKATASGARFYGRDIVSAEAYTFIHPARYRTDLQDLKIATDAFLRDGVTQFYNHGYFASPEMHVAPSRDMPWANRISHWNTWWPYYHHVATYVARCCSMLRQGQLVADVLLYSPQATAWSERAIWEGDRRVMPYGNLAKTLVANGYDFDIVNDDLLQNAATFHDGVMEINQHVRRVLILPRATVIPLASMRAIARFVAAGGTVVALDSLPVSAAGMNNYEQNDRELKQIVSGLFSGKGNAVFLPEYTIDRTPLNPGRKPYTPTAPLEKPQKDLLAILNRVKTPDFAPVDRAQSDGLTFIHKKIHEIDMYFITNLQPKRVATNVVFRVTGKVPQRWDAVSGTIHSDLTFKAQADGIVMPLTMDAWESAFFIFVPGLASQEKIQPLHPATISEPLLVTGTWTMQLEGFGFESYTTTCTALSSWTDNSRTRHFSGTGRYDIDVDIPADRIRNGAHTVLDLGQVGNIADVRWNDHPVGVAWMAPHHVDITQAVRVGKNHLTVLVTNTLINYVTGLSAPPEVPIELQSRLGTAHPKIYPHSNPKEMHETDLPPSGLLGPVRIIMKESQEN